MGVTLTLRKGWQRAKAKHSEFKKIKTKQDLGPTLDKLETLAQKTYAVGEKTAPMVDGLKLLTNRAYNAIDTYKKTIQRMDLDKDKDKELIAALNGQESCIKTDLKTVAKKLKESVDEIQKLLRS